MEWESKRLRNDRFPFTHFFRTCCTFVAVWSCHLLQICRAYTPTRCIRLIYCVDCECVIFLQLDSCNLVLSTLPVLLSESGSGERRAHQAHTHIASICCRIQNYCTKLKSAKGTCTALPYSKENQRYADEVDRMGGYVLRSRLDRISEVIQN